MWYMAIKEVYKSECGILATSIEIWAFQIDSKYNRHQKVQIKELFLW